MVITRLEIKDLGGVEHYVADFDSFNLIVGKNGAGKTTVLRILESFFGGGSDPDLIRLGCEHGTAILTLENGSIFTKTQKRDGYTLEGRTAEGARIGGPATFLKDLAGGLAFDPIAFLEAEPAKQSEYLLKNLPVALPAAAINAILGEQRITRATITIPDLNGLIEAAYVERRDATRRENDLGASIDSLTRALPCDAAANGNWQHEAERLTIELTETTGQMSRAAKESDEAFGQIQRKLTKESDASIATVKEKLSDALEQAKQKIDAAHKAADASVATIRETLRRSLEQEREEIDAAQQERTAKLQEHKIQVSESRIAAMKNAEQEQRATFVRGEIEAKKRARVEEAKRNERLTGVIEALRKLKLKSLAELPIAGIGVTDEAGKPEVTINGLKIGQLNRQAQIFFAVQATQAVAPNALVICEAAELDDNSIGMLAAAAKQAGTQMVVARWRNAEPLRVERI